MSSYPNWIIYTWMIMMGVLLIVGVTIYSNTTSSSRFLFIKKSTPQAKGEIGEAKKKTAQLKRDLTVQVEALKDSALVAGFIAKGDYILAVAHCTSCHSSELVTQNRATKEGWQEIIWWMQKTQKLWDLGKDEKKIVDYLATYYAPQEIGRRSNLMLRESDWYVIE